MELEELKKSWVVLDEKLQAAPIANEEQLAKLIETSKGKVKKNLHSLLNWERFSLWIGIPLCLLVLLAFGAIYYYSQSVEYRWRTIIMILFWIATCIFAVWGDFRSYRITQKIDIGNMPISKVQQYMTQLSRHIRIEIIAMCLWFPLFNLLYLWFQGLIDYLPTTALLCAMGVLLFLDFIIIYAIYKRFIFKYIRCINQNINELKDLCIE